jgi:hypothetical protein
MRWLLSMTLITAATTAGAQENPAASLERMSWDAPCAEIREHLATALDRNDAIAADARQGVQTHLDQAAEAGGDRAACLEPLKQAYDELVAAYENTPASPNILGGATTAPGDPAAVEPESLEGPLTGRRVGENPEGFD